MPMILMTLSARDGGAKAVISQALSSITFTDSCSPAGILPCHV